MRTVKDAQITTSFDEEIIHVTITGTKVIVSMKNGTSYIYTPEDFL